MTISVSYTHLIEERQKPHIGQIQLRGAALDSFAIRAISHAQEQHGVVGAAQCRGIENHIEALLHAHVPAVRRQELISEIIPPPESVPLLRWQIDERVVHARLKKLDLIFTKTFVDDLLPHALRERGDQSRMAVRRILDLIEKRCV